MQLFPRALESQLGFGLGLVCGIATPWTDRLSYRSANHYGADKQLHLAGVGQSWSLSSPSNSMADAQFDKLEPASIMGLSRRLPKA